MLAILTEPAEAKPGEAVTYRSLVASPDGTVDAVPSWAFCTAPKPPTEDNAVSTQCADGAALEPIGQYPTVSSAIPADACTRFGPEVPPGDFRPARSRRQRRLLPARPRRHPASRRVRPDAHHLQARQRHRPALARLRAQLRGQQEPLPRAPDPSPLTVPAHAVRPPDRLLARRGRRALPLLRPARPGPHHAPRVHAPVLVRHRRLDRRRRQRRRRGRPRDPRDDDLAHARSRPRARCGSCSATCRGGIATREVHVTVE